MTKPITRTKLTYRHKAARQVLFDWLDKPARHDEDPDSYWSLSPLGARGRTIFKQFILALDKTNHVVGAAYGTIWDETPIPGMTRFGDDEFPGRTPCFDEPPSIEGIIELGMIPFLTLDIAIRHKGAIIQGLIITRDGKLDPIRYARCQQAASEDGNLEIYTISDTWILDQIEKPKTLEGIVRRVA
jgi:hypothetical protein